LRYQSQNDQEAGPILKVFHSDLSLQDTFDEDSVLRKSDPGHWTLLNRFELSTL
jgi:hypothetical protein